MSLPKLITIAFVFFALFMLSFPMNAQLTWGPLQDVDQPGGVVKVYAQDIDNNGTVDLITAATTSGVRWYSNDGAGNFTLSQALEQSGDQFSSKAAAIFDFDGDGDLDIVAIADIEASTNPTTIQYFVNQGAGVYSIGGIIGQIGTNGQEIRPYDLDSDGDMDVVYAESADDELGWIPNLGSGSWGNPILINTQSNGAQDVRAMDVEGDGDMDIFVAGEYDDEFVWHENDGSENFGSQIVIGSGNNVESIATGDLDGDGIEDIAAVYALDYEVIWARNNGTGFDTPQDLNSDGGYSVNFPITIELIDLDQDNDLDAVVCSILDNTIRWYPNDGSGNFDVPQEITTSAANVRQVALADLDGDGDLDVASANFGAGQVAWYENTSPVIVAGCTDVNACNYDPQAVNEDGSCYTLGQPCDDGDSCTEGEVWLDCLTCGVNTAPAGCTDPIGCNYDLLAEVDDNSCIYACAGYDCAGVCLDENTNGICDFEEVAGCTDPTAINYMPAANVDDGSCSDGSVLCGEGTVWDADLGVCISDGSSDLGCTDPLALNYDPTASSDDGSCIFGESFCDSGTFWDEQLQACVAIGTPSCPGDFNDDGNINTGDLLQFLTLFGTDCTE